MFSALALVANLGLIVVFGLGYRIGDGSKFDDVTRRLFSQHFLAALGVGVLVMLVHGIALTYFMGTGRWIEETVAAYQLSPATRQANVRLKYRAIPGMVCCIVLLVVTFAFGAMSDPASGHPTKWAPYVHFALGTSTLFANLIVSWIEYNCIRRNGELIRETYAAVQKIRAEKGLD